MRLRNNIGGNEEIQKGAVFFNKALLADKDIKAGVAAGFAHKIEIAAQFVNSQEYPSIASK